MKLGHTRNPIRLAKARSIIAAMGFQVAPVGYRFEQTQHMLASLRAPTVNEYSVCGHQPPAQAPDSLTISPLFLIRSSDPTCSETWVSFGLEAMRDSPH